MLCERVSARGAARAATFCNALLQMILHNASIIARPLLINSIGTKTSPMPDVYLTKVSPRRARFEALTRLRN